MKLYSLPLSPYAARVRCSIYAKNLPVEIVAPPADWRTSPEYRKLNPLIRIPVLVLDDGTMVPESGIIVEYLEDAYPEPSLRPRSAKDLARVRLITQVAETYATQAISPLFQLFDTTERDEAAITAQLAKLDTALKQLNDLLQPRHVCGWRSAHDSGHVVGTLSLYARRPHELFGPYEFGRAARSCGCLRRRCATRSASRPRLARNG